MSREIVALGNTASVMSTISQYIPHVKVGCPPVLNPAVIQRNENCFDIPGSNVSSVSWVRLVSSPKYANTLFHAELPYAPACRRAGVPYGIHIHGTTDAQLLYPRTRTGSLLKSSFRDALEDASYVLSHEMLLEVVRRLRPDASKFETPVDLEQFAPDGGSIRLNAGVNLLIPGRIDQWKGHQIIWKALRAMRNRDRLRAFQADWGWEPYYGMLKASAPGSVSFIPTVPRGRIAEYYRGADIVVGQMQLGYFGMAELEAAACGVPVTVYSKDPFSPFLPKSPDPMELASLLDRLIEDNGFRSKYAIECREYVVRNHEAKRLAEKFSSLVDQSPRHPRGGLGFRDIVQLELGTALEIAEKVLGAPDRYLRRKLLEA